MRTCSALIGRLSCPCSQFQGGSNADVCDNCSHSFSHHSPPVVTEPVPGSSSQASSMAPSRARSVTALFQSLIGSTRNGSLALQETSNGLRSRSGAASAVVCTRTPPSWNEQHLTNLSQNSSRLRQPSIRGANSQIWLPNPTFRFRSVVFITCGLEADELVSPSICPHCKATADRVLQLGTVSLTSKTPLPNNHAIQVAVRDGLGITSANERQLFELDRDGILPDMNSFLRSHMPKLFNHFAKTKPWILTINQSNWADGDRIWPYMLLARANRNLVPAVLNGHVDPTVSDF